MPWHSGRLIGRECDLPSEEKLKTQRGQIDIRAGITSRGVARPGVIYRQLPCSVPSPISYGANINSSGVSVVLTGRMQLAAWQSANLPLVHDFYFSSAAISCVMQRNGRTTWFNSSRRPPITRFGPSANNQTRISALIDSIRIERTMIASSNAIFQR